MADFLNLDKYNLGRFSAEETITLSTRYWVIVIVKLCLSEIFRPAAGQVFESYKNGQFLEVKQT